jgi:hypothetical protein
MLQKIIDFFTKTPLREDIEEMKIVVQQAQQIMQEIKVVIADTKNLSDTVRCAMQQALQRNQINQ